MSSPDSQPGSRAAVLAPWLAVSAVLLLALELRLLFQTGLADIDALVYSHLARNVADGVFTQNAALPLEATARVGLYGPVAVFYALFGSSHLTTFAWPLVCSLLGVALAYGIGRRLAGEAAGLMAAFVWTVLPTGVAAATALMGDGPIAAASMGVVYFLLLAESTGGKKRAAALAAGLACLIIGMASKPAMVLIAVFLVAYVVWTRPTRLVAWLGLGVALAAVIAAYVFYTARQGYSMKWLWLTIVPSRKVLADASLDWWTHVVLGSPEFSWIAPLWIVAFAVLIALRRREAYLPMLWFASLFFYLAFGTRSLGRYEPITTASLGTGTTRHFLLVAAPAVIVSGIYLAQSLRPVTARWLVAAAAALTAAIAWTGTRHATNLDWGMTGETMLPFEVKSGLAIALTIFGSIASPVFTSGAHARWKVFGVGLLTCAIGIASLNLSYRAAATYRASWLATMPEAVRFLESEPPLPIFVQNEVFGQRLDYSSGFRLGFNSILRDPRGPTRIFLAPQDPEIVHDAYLLVDEYSLRTSPTAGWGNGPAYLADPPASFVEVARFGDQAGYQLKVYRVSEVLGPKELDAARAAARGTKNAGTLHRLLLAAAGAGEYCEAAGAWQALRGEAASFKRLDALPLIKGCVARQTAREPNLFQNGDFAEGLKGWERHPGAEATVSVSDEGPDQVWHVKWVTGNWSPIYQAQVLKPDTAYIYEADIKTTVPVVALYWQPNDDVGRFFNMSAKYPDWTRLTYVFITPHWNGQPRPVGFNPVLMHGPGEAWLKSLRLSEFRAPNVP